MELSWKVTSFLLCVLVCAITRECSATLTITQGRITQGPFALKRQIVVGLATIELGGDSASQPTYFFDCVSNRNNGSGLRWTRLSTSHTFTVNSIPDNVPGIRMDVGGIDYADLDIYICSDRFSDDVARLNVTDLNPALMAAEERVEVLQGETVALEIYTSGYPFPTESSITWQYPNSSRIKNNDTGVTFEDDKRKLVLTNVQSSQAGMYPVTVIISFSPYMGATIEIQLDVHVPTVFVTQPVESVDTLEWSAVTLTCSASGVPKPQIRWERENQPTLPVGAETEDDYMQNTGNTTTSQLVFAKIRYEAIARYRCEADNGQTGAVVSDYTNVKVTPALRLYDSSMNEVSGLHFVNNGSLVLVECFGSGSLQWSSASGSSIPFADSGIIYQSYDQTRDALALTIPNYMSTNTDVYTCMTDLTGTYNGPITVPVLITSSNPAVFLLSSFHYVLPGNTTTLEARVYASPSTSASVAWYHENILINVVSDARYTASSEGDIYRLQVNNVGSDELGKYTITVTLNGRTVNDTTTLSYPEPPSAMIIPPSITVNEGEEVTIVCMAQGSGTVTVTWTISGADVLPDGVQARGNELVITSVSSSHPGTYVCTVSNLAGTNEDEVILNVNYSPRVVVTFNEMMSMPGQPLYLVRDDGAPGPTVTCTAVSQPSSTIRWVQVNGRGLPNGITQSIQPNGDVQLRWQRPMEFTDSGIYFCQASNNVGNGSAILEVLVEIEPSISSIYPFSNDITQDTETFSYTVPLNYVGSTLVCTVNGWPAPEVEWQKDGEPLSSSSSVVSESSTMVATVSARLRWTREFLSSDEGNYACVVRKPNTAVPVTSQFVQLKAGATTPTSSTMTCTVQGQSVFFQIRVFGTDCMNWGGSLSTYIATEFRNELLSVVRTECNCEVDESELEVLGSPQCSTDVEGAAVFRGKIETASQAKTEETFCSLFSWQQKSPLIRINDQFRAVDPGCSLRASGTLDSEECVAPANPSPVFGTMEIAYAIGAAAVFLILILVIILLIGVCCYYCQRKERKGDFNINAAEETDHTYARTDSFSKYSHGVVKHTPSSGSGITEEPVYSTLTRGNEPPHEAIALRHLPSDSNPATAPEPAESSMQAHPSRSQLQSAEAYQIPISSQENLTSPAPGSVGTFQAMKRHTSSTSTSGYDSTSHLLGPAQKTHTSTGDSPYVISATSPFNDYEHIDGDDAFALNSPNSTSGESPATPGKVHGRQQSVGSLGLHQQSSRGQSQASGAMSASVPLAFNPSHDRGQMIFAVVEEDEKEDLSQAISTSQQAFDTGRLQHEDVISRSHQQSCRVSGNQSPSGSTGSASSRGMKQSIIAQFQSTDNVTSTRGRESNCSEAPPPYSSRPSSEAVLTADSADSSVMDSKTYVGADGRQRPWYQASDLSIDSNAQSSAPLTLTSTSSSSQASTSTDGGRIHPYATTLSENLPFSKQGNSMKDPHKVITRKTSNPQRSGVQAKAPAQPYAEPVRSSVASLGHAQESPTFFEVVV